MLIYQETKKTFLADIESEQVIPKIHALFKSRFGTASQSLIRSWEDSVDYMFKVLANSLVSDTVGIAIEYNIPSTSKRIDFTLTGYDVNHHDSVVIIEFKQWSECSKVEGKDGIVQSFVGGGVRELLHPSYQAWSYAALLKDFNETVQKENIEIIPCACLHNYSIVQKDVLLDPQYREYYSAAPLFGHGDLLKLRDFIEKYIKYGDNKEVLYKVENGNLRPSKRLQDALLGMLSGKREFVMIDDQKVIFEEAVQLARKSYVDGKKRVLIVNGGPGTGKTVLAMNLLVELTKQNLVVNYTTKNAAPRKVFRDKLKEGFRANYIDNLFKSSGTYIDAEKDVFDALVVDEAHRLNDRTKLGPGGVVGENQIKEIIHASKFSIFFLDEDQRVTLDDIGSVEEIKKHAARSKADVFETQLASQFRCNGSDGYLAWLDNVLQIRETANRNLDFNYDFRIVDDPNELRRLIVDKNTNNKSRLVAGYCWEWPKKTQNDPTYHDIRIDRFDFEMSWNLAIGETFATDPDAIGRVGCIHTVQGLEFDYVGVIIGNDMRFENGKVITDYTRRAKSDKSLSGLKRLMEQDEENAKRVADEIIRNTYRTLMTRGMKGCYVFCQDPNLSQFFLSQINNLKS